MLLSYRQYEFGNLFDTFENKRTWIDSSYIYTHITTNIAYRIKQVWATVLTCSFIAVIASGRGRIILTHYYTVLHREDVSHTQW